MEAGVNDAVAAYKRQVLSKIPTFLVYMAGARRDAVIDFEFLRGRQNETVVKEHCVASATTNETFWFNGPYKMADHRSSENGVHCAEGHIECKESHTLISDTVSCFAHVFAYGVYKSRSSKPSRDVRSIT